MRRPGTIPIALLVFSVVGVVVSLVVRRGDPVNPPTEKLEPDKEVVSPVPDPLTPSKDLSVGDPEEPSLPDLPLETPSSHLAFLFFGTNEPASATQWTLRSTRSPGSEKIEQSASIPPDGLLPVTEGNWQILSSDPKLDTLPSTVEVAPNRRHLVWVLRKMALQVRVTDPGRDPIPDAEVFYWPIEDRRRDQAPPVMISAIPPGTAAYEASTDRNGVVVLDGIEPVGRMLVLAKNYEPSWVTIHGERKESLSIVLTPQTRESLTFQISAYGGGPIEGASLSSSILGDLKVQSDSRGMVKAPGWVAADDMLRVEALGFVSVEFRAGGLAKPGHLSLMPDCLTHVRVVGADGSPPSQVQLLVEKTSRNFRSTVNSSSTGSFSSTPKAGESQGYPDRSLSSFRRSGQPGKAQKNE